MARLDGKVALVTGGAAGLGRVAAELFAAEGAAVVVTDLVEPTDTVEAVVRSGGAALGVVADMKDADAVRAAVEAAERTFGGLHVLHNNAGVSLADDDGVVETEESVWDTTLRVNVTGVALGCRYAIPAMRRTIAAAGGPDRGVSASIVNVASFVAHVGAATPQVAYTASKGAVLALTREVAVIHAREGIRVNALCPGPVLTPLLAKYLNTEERRQRRLVHIPMGRFGRPEEIAQGALFLASDESSFMTGQSLLVDGGITAAYTTPE